MTRHAWIILLFALASATAGAQMLPDTSPRVGVDYEVLPTPQPTYGRGGIEVAEVFSYRCIHCAKFQPSVDAWLKSNGAGLRWEYVPAAFGGTWDDFARAFFAAQALGVQQKTHAAVFKAIFELKKISTGTPEEIATMYAGLGVDKSKFLAAMKSPAVDLKLRKAHDFAVRTGIQGTPTLILDGKYRIAATTDRGFDGMLSTLDYLLFKERAAQAAARATH